MKWPHALLVAAAALMLATCASSGSTVSTAARPPSAVDGRFLWQDLVTTNATAARAFYSALLGWEFAETTRGGRPYLIARTAAGPVGGLVDIRDIKDAGSQWVTYVAVADIDRTVGQVQAAGGRVIVPPTATSAGRAAVVVDPQGAALGLLQTSREAPADGLKLVNAHFFWREYLAQDATQALAFYTGLLGYEGREDRRQTRSRVLRVAERQPASRARPDSRDDQAGAPALVVVRPGG